MYFNVHVPMCEKLRESKHEYVNYTDTSKVSRFPIRIHPNPTPMKHDTYAKERNKINTGRICLTLELETLSYIIPLYIPYKHTRAKGSSVSSKSFCNAIHFTSHRPRRERYEPPIPKDHLSFVVQSIRRLTG